MTEIFPNEVKKKSFTESQNSVNLTEDKNKEIILRHITQLLKKVKEKNTERKMTQHLQGNNDKND